MSNVEEDFIHEYQYARYSKSNVDYYKKEITYGPEYGRNTSMSTFAPAQAADDVLSTIGLIFAGLIALWFVGLFGGVLLTMILILASSVLGLNFDPFDHPLSFLLLAFASLCLMGAHMRWTDHVCLPH